MSDHQSIEDLLGREDLEAGRLASLKKAPKLPASWKADRAVKPRTPREGSPTPPPVGACPEYDPSDDARLDFLADGDEVDLEDEQSRTNGVELIRHLLPGAVLLKIARGEKRPLDVGWQRLSQADMTPAYVRGLEGYNVGVLLGPASGHLNTIDIDNDDFVEPFLELNPRLEDTLMTKRVRGRNFWVVTCGEYPKLGKIKTSTGADWGEWRSTGGQTVIHGEVIDRSKGETMPTTYRMLNAVKPIEITFDDIVWPAGCVMPWRKESASTTSVPPPVQATDDGVVDGGDSLIILPSGEVSISECAELLFKKIGITRTLFYRGGAVMELVLGDDGALALDLMKPASFRSRIEGFGRVVAWRSGANGGAVLKPAICPEETAHALLETLEAKELLPRISTVINSPIMIEAGDELLILPHGYHPQCGGVLVTNGTAPPEVPIEEAVESLEAILAEFEFQTNGDRSRALAHLITPALKVGNHIHGFVPADVAEADQSQAGKTFRQRITSALYNEKPRVVARRDGGVGSVDESFAQALISGRPFIQIDNLRGKFDSQFIEAFLTAKGGFPARVPHRGEIMVDPSRFFLQITSNGVETTRDMANRSSLVRIRKRTGFAYRSFPEGDLLDHVIARQSYFLGSVFAVVRRWVEQGKPRSPVTDHDFRDWAQSLDWIVQHIFRAAPLLEGHQRAQERVSNPALSFLRLVALEVRKVRKLGTTLSAVELVDLCEEAGIEIPGLKSGNTADASRKVGVLMKRAFAEGDTVHVEEFTVTRIQWEQCRSGGGSYSTKAYQFRQ